MDTLRKMALLGAMMLSAVVGFADWYEGTATIGKVTYSYWGWTNSEHDYCCVENLSFANGFDGVLNLPTKVDGHIVTGFWPYGNSEQLDLVTTVKFPVGMSFSIYQWTFESFRNLKTAYMPINVFSTGTLQSHTDRHIFVYGIETLHITGNGAMPERFSEECKFQGLRTLIFDGKVTEISKNAFKNYGDLESVELPNGLVRIGTKAFCWCYNLNNMEIPSTVKYIGKFAFCGCPAIDSDAEDFAAALNVTNTLVTTDSDAPWYVRLGNSVFNDATMTSGFIGDNQHSDMSVTAKASGEMSFWWKVWSEENCDELKLLINGSAVESVLPISGKREWERVTISINKGDVITWRYEKDDSGSDGADAGWVDLLQMPEVPIEADAMNAAACVEVSRCFDKSEWTRLVERLDQEITASPKDCKLRIYRAIATIMNAITDQRLRDLFEKSGYELEIGDIFNLDAVKAQGVLSFDKWPKTDVAIDTIAEVLVPAIKAAQTDLNIIPEKWTETVELNANLIPILSETVYVDNGDVLLAKASLEAALGTIDYLQAQQLNVNYNKQPIVLNNVWTQDFQGNCAEYNADLVTWTKASQEGRNVIKQSSANIVIDGKDKDWSAVKQTAKIETWNNSDTNMTIDWMKVVNNGDDLCISVKSSSILPRRITECSIGITIPDDSYIHTYIDIGSMSGGIRSYNGNVDTYCYDSNYGDWYDIDASAQVTIAYGFAEVKLSSAFLADLPDEADVSIQFMSWDYDEYYGVGFRTYPNELEPSFNQVLKDHPELLTKVRNTAKLTSSKTHTTEAMRLALVADSAIASRTDSMLHFFEYDPNDAEILSEARSYAKQAQASLKSAQTIDLTSTSFGEKVKVYLGGLFDTKGLIRSVLPPVTDDNKIVLSKAPDYTIRGILSGANKSTWQRWMTRAGIADRISDGSETSTSDLPTVSVNVGSGCEEMGTVSGGKTAKAGTKLSLKATAKKGYVFAGWYTDADFEEPCDGGSVDYRSPTLAYVVGEDDAELYARFVSTDDDYVEVWASLADEYERGVAIEPIEIGVESESIATIRVTGLPTGLKFTAKALSVKATKTTSAAEYAANTIYGTPTKSGVYAVMVTATTASKKTAAETFKIVVRADGEAIVDAEWETGKGKVTGMGICAKGKTLTLKAVASKGYVFAGWYLDANFEEQYNGSADYRSPSLPVIGDGLDKTYYARFALSEYDTDIVANVEDSYNVNGPWSLKLDIDSLSLPTVTVKGLPTGLKFDSKSLTISGTPTKPGVYMVTLSLKNVTVKTAKTQTFVINVANIESPYLDGVSYETDAYNYRGGVSVGWNLGECATDGYSVSSVSGLPTGLKFNAKTGMIEGVPSKAGTYTVTIMLKNGKQTSLATITMTIAAIDGWAYGMFGGGSDAGQIQISITSAGKLSGKCYEDGITYTLSSASFTEYGDGVYYADATVSWSYRNSDNKLIKQSDVWSVIVEEGDIGGMVTVNDQFYGWQYNWKVEPWKTTLKSANLTTMTYYILNDGSYSDCSESGILSLGEDVVGKVTLKFSTSGAITTSGEFVTGYDEKRKKYTTVKATGSAALVPEDFYTGIVYIYLAPKGLEIHTRRMEVLLRNEVQYEYHLCKPVIYFYPETETTYDVKLTLNGSLTCTYPYHGTNGWNGFVASPDGTLTFPNGQQYYCLYWEGTMNEKWNFDYGYCIKGADTSSFLAEVLIQMGLSFREANEFIIYWLPLMQDNPYNVIAFQGDNYVNNANLEITPQPDSILRIFMTWYPSNQPVEITEPIIKPFSRIGFTVVEWGGSKVNL